MGPVTAQVIERRVVGDLQDPRREPQPHIERPQAAEDLRERLLCQVFGRARILHHPDDQVEHGPLIAADDLARGRLVPGEGLADNLRVRRGGEVGSLERRSGLETAHMRSGQSDERHRDEVPLDERAMRRPSALRFRLLAVAPRLRADPCRTAPRRSVARASRRRCHHARRSRRCRQSRRGTAHLRLGRVGR